MTATAPEPHGTGNPKKRRAIMAAATAVFLREGYTRAGVDTIAAEAGVSKQTVYNHFGDKENLFLSVTSSAQNDAVARVTETIDAAFPDRESLRTPATLRSALITLTGEWIRHVYVGDLSALRKLVTAEAEHHPELLRQWLANGPRRTMPRFNRLLVELGRDGVLDLPPDVVDDEELLAQQLVSTAATDVQRIPPESDWEPEFAKRVARGVDFFLRAYAPR
jgi:TetR/AcrR family transcriptional repressor of mexJK operon